MSETAPETDAATIRILLIDDHRMFVEAITEVLNREPDLDVVGVAISAAAGLALAASTMPDIAIVDYMLPDGDGAALTVSIREASPRTQVVVLSGSGVASHVVAAVEAGCAGFVTKDKAADELVTALRCVHGGEPYIEPSLVAHLLPRVNRPPQQLGDDLTHRELETLQLLADGLSNQAIAARFVLSPHTVRNHVQNVLAKLHAHSKLEAVVIATREGVLQRTV